MKEQILIKHISSLTEEEKDGLVEISELKNQPTWLAALAAMEEYALLENSNFTKKLAPTVKTTIQADGSEDLDSVHFEMTLVIDKKNNMKVFNTEADGDWKETVDCDTLLVKTIKVYI